MTGRRHDDARETRGHMPAGPEKNFTAADCTDTSYTAPLADRVIAVKREMLPLGHDGMLFVCVGEGVTNPHIIDKTVFAVSLSDGEAYRFGRSDISGTLMPDLLPENARLMLSQIRPHHDFPRYDGEPYTGYAFLGDGRYSAGVRLAGPAEAVAYLKMQAPYQHRVLICDGDDCIAAEAIRGIVTFPMQTESPGQTESQSPGIGMR
jgi:hypothetical protein